MFVQMEFLWLGVRKKLSINNEKGDARRLSSGKETDIHVHTRFVFFHHNDGGGDFGRGVDHTCPIPGPEGQVVHRGSGCLIGQFQIQSTDVLTILGPTEFQGSLSVLPVLQQKCIFAISSLSPVLKRRDHLFETWIPSSKDAFCKIWSI